MPSLASPSTLPDKRPPLFMGPLLRPGPLFRRCKGSRLEGEWLWFFLCCERVVPPRVPAHVCFFFPSLSLPPLSPSPPFSKKGMMRLSFCVMPSNFLDYFSCPCMIRWPSLYQTFVYSKVQCENISVRLISAWVICLWDTKIFIHWVTHVLYATTSPSP
jgi:hypothetical protein